MKYLALVACAWAHEEAVHLDGCHRFWWPPPHPAPPPRTGYSSRSCSSSRIRDIACIISWATEEYHVKGFHITSSQPSFLALGSGNSIHVITYKLIPEPFKKNYNEKVATVPDHLLHIHPFHPWEGAASDLDSALCHRQDSVCPALRCPGKGYSAAQYRNVIFPLFVLLWKRSYGIPLSMVLTQHVLHRTLIYVENKVPSNFLLTYEVHPKANWKMWIKREWLQLGGKIFLEFLKKASIANMITLLF